MAAQQDLHWDSRKGEKFSATFKKRDTSVQPQIEENDREFGKHGHNDPHLEKIVSLDFWNSKFCSVLCTCLIYSGSPPFITAIVRPCSTSHDCSAVHLTGLHSCVSYFLNVASAFGTYWSTAQGWDLTPGEAFLCLLSHFHPVNPNSMLEHCQCWSCLQCRQTQETVNPCTFSSWRNPTGWSNPK